MFGAFEAANRARAGAGDPWCHWAPKACWRSIAGPDPNHANSGRSRNSGHSSRCLLILVFRPIALDRARTASEDSRTPAGPSSTEGGAPGHIECDCLAGGMLVRALQNTTSLPSGCQCVLISINRFAREPSGRVDDRPQIEKGGIGPRHCLERVSAYPARSGKTAHRVETKIHRDDFSKCRSYWVCIGARFVGVFIVGEREELARTELKHARACLPGLRRAQTLNARCSSLWACPSS
jgi:hypothetical protein